MIVTTRLDDLQGELCRVGVTELGVPISAGQARRLACGAGIIPAVLDTHSVPINLGATARLFNTHQHHALATLYAGCAADGCDRPFAWCELHHLDPWNRSRNTNLDNGVPLCPTHHRMIDRTDLTHTIQRISKGVVRTTFHPRT